MVSKTVTRPITVNSATRCHTLPHVIPGGVLRISSDGDDRRISWGFEIFHFGKFGEYIFGWLGVHASRDFSRYLKQTEDSWLCQCILLQTQTFNSKFIFRALSFTSFWNVKDFQARKFGMGIF